MAQPSCLADFFSPKQSCPKVCLTTFPTLIHVDPILRPQHGRPTFRLTGGLQMIHVIHNLHEVRAVVQPLPGAALLPAQHSALQAVQVLASAYEQCGVSCSVNFVLISCCEPVAFCEDRLGTCCLTAQVLRAKLVSKQRHTVGRTLHHTHIPAR